MHLYNKKEFKGGIIACTQRAGILVNDHNEVFSKGLNNFAFGVLKQVDPRFLADAENLFIVQLCTLS